MKLKIFIAVSVIGLALGYI